MKANPVLILVLSALLFVLHLALALPSRLSAETPDNSTSADQILLIEKLASTRPIGPEEFTPRELRSAAEKMFGLFPPALKEGDARFLPYRNAFLSLGAGSFKERRRAQKELSEMAPQPAILTSWISQTEDPEMATRGRQVLEHWQKTNELIDASLDGAVEKFMVPLTRFPMGSAKASVIQALDARSEEQSLSNWSKKLGKATLYGLPVSERREVMRAWMNPPKRRLFPSLLQGAVDFRPVDKDHEDIEWLREIVQWMLLEEKGVANYSQAWQLTWLWLREIPGEIKYAPLAAKIPKSWGRLYLSAAFVRRGDLDALPQLLKAIPAEAEYIDPGEFMRFLDPITDDAKNKILTVLATRTAQTLQDELKNGIPDPNKKEKFQEHFYAHNNRYLIFRSLPVANRPPMKQVLQKLAGMPGHYLYCPASAALWLGGEREPFRMLDLKKARLDYAAIPREAFENMWGQMREEFFMAKTDATRDQARTDILQLMRVQAACLAAGRDREGRDFSPGTKRQTREFIDIYTKEVLPLGLHAHLRAELTRLATWVSKPESQRERFHERSIVALVMEARADGKEKELVESWTARDKPIAPDLLVNEVLILNRYSGGTEAIRKILKQHWTTVCLTKTPWFVLDAVTRVDIRAGSRQEEKHRTLPHSAFLLDLQARKLKHYPEEILPQLPKNQQTLTKLAWGMETQLPKTMPLADSNFRWSMIELQKRKLMDESLLQDSFNGWMSYFHQRKLPGKFPKEQEISEIAELAALGKIVASADFPRPEARAVQHVLRAEQAIRGGDWQQAAKEWQATIPLAPGVGPGLRRSRIKQQELMCRWLAGEEDNELLFNEMKNMTITFFPDFSTLLIAFLLDQGERKMALDLFELHLARTVEPEAAPDWLHLMLTWEYAMARNWHAARNRVRHVIRHGRSSAIVRQALMLEKLLRDPGVPFVNYLEARHEWRKSTPKATLTALIEYAGGTENMELKSLALWQAAGFASQLGNEQQSRSLCRQGILEGTVFASLCEIQADSVDADECAGKLTSSKMEATPIGAEISPFGTSLGLTARKGKAAKFFRRQRWFTSRGIPLTTDLQLWIYDGWGSWTPLRVADHFVISGPRRLVAESDEGHEVHQVNVLPLRPEKK